MVTIDNFYHLLLLKSVFTCSNNQPRAYSIMDLHQPRKASRIVTGIPTTDGGGVHLNRVMGTHYFNMLDPFLLLDEFHSDKSQDYIAGFPDHPHRGFETVTYMLAGRIRHKDNAGHEGVVEAGGIQWMSAGKGIIHSEMPEQDNGLMWGFQLWINLPAAEKMSQPRYQEFNSEQIPREIRDGNIIVRVITGTTSLGTQGPVNNVATHPLYLNIELPPDTEFTEPVDISHNAFIYVYTGELHVINSDKSEEPVIKQGSLAILDNGDGIYLKAASSGAKCLLVSALPLNEPVVRSGPFVMNTREEINQAIQDYQQGLF